MKILQTSRKILPRPVEYTFDSFLQPFSIRLLPSANELSHVSGLKTQWLERNRTHIKPASNDSSIRIACAHQAKDRPSSIHDLTLFMFDVFLPLAAFSMLTPSAVVFLFGDENFLRASHFVRCGISHIADCQSVERKHRAIGETDAP